MTNSTIKFQCSCGKEFPNKSDLNNHTRDMVGQVPEHEGAMIMGPFENDDDMLNFVLGKNVEIEK